MNDNNMSRMTKSMFSKLDNDRIIRCAQYYAIKIACQT